MKSRKNKHAELPNGRIDWAYLTSIQGTEQYSLEYALLGGPNKEYIRQECKRKGIPMRWCYSPYQGQYGVEVRAIDAKAFEKNVLNWR